MYRIATLPFGSFENEKVLVKYNKQLKWHLRKVQLEEDGAIFIIVQDVPSKKRILKLVKENNWKVI